MDVEFDEKNTGLLVEDGHFDSPVQNQRKSCTVYITYTYVFYVPT